MWSPLAKILRDNLTKKVALKLPKTIESLTDMSGCFVDCTTIVSLAGIPSGIMNMENCFTGCTSLKSAPVIPQSAMFMHDCFNGCGKLQSVVLKCDYRDGAFNDLFKNCNALKEKGIKVPQAYYVNYTTDTAINKMKVPGTDETEQKAKFEGLTELNP